jgi:hypothetical protein
MPARLLVDLPDRCLHERFVRLPATSRPDVAPVVIRADNDPRVDLDQAANGDHELVREIGLAQIPADPQFDVVGPLLLRHRYRKKAYGEDAGDVIVPRSVAGSSHAMKRRDVGPPRTNLVAAAPIQTLRDRAVEVLWFERSWAATGCSLQGCTDLGHPEVGETSQSFDEDAHRHAFHRVQVDRTPPRDGVLTRVEDYLGGQSSDCRRAGRHQRPSQSGDGSVTGKDDNWASADVRRLTPPHFPSSG